MRLGVAPALALDGVYDERGELDADKTHMLIGNRYVAAAKARLIQATADEKRYRRLLPSGAVSASEYDATKAAADSARALLDAAQAQLEGEVRRRSGRGAMPVDQLQPAALHGQKTGADGAHQGRAVTECSANALAVQFAPLL